MGLHLGLPRTTVPGLPVIEHAEFGKEVNSYRLFPRIEENRPEDRMTLGRVFDLGQITKKIVELDNRSLNMHTFITGSTGSGKSNAVYQMLSELHQDKIPFLVIEPAKGEYKDVFGNWSDVNVYSTNPKVAELININPFKFPDSIHVLEHVDGLVEIFGVCWPMYDAMPAFFKDAILKSYEAVGWDLGSSTFEGEESEYPDFEILAEQLGLLIDNSDYASDIKSNYRGALLTRVKSLTVGLNKFIFTSEQTEYEKLFDQNCILDISRVKSTETKALLMGLMVYILNEYRVDRKTESNNGLKHVTVLEEAHNLLKNTSQGGESELIGKSVEMLTNTIAEIRTYGEGFIIVDQSPSSVDIAAIKNTNTKIVLRTPEANDRDAVGRSIGLTEDQVNEIAKLPSGVAVVYQNDWINPVLTMINKADVVDSPYKYVANIDIKPLREARTDIVKMLLQPWLDSEKMTRKFLRNSLKSIELERNERKEICDSIDDYIFSGYKSIWNEGRNATTYFDDNGVGYLRKVTQLGDNHSKVISSKLAPEVTITKGNFTAVTDAYGRPVLNKISDLSIKEAPRESLSSIKKDGNYRVNDHRGHIIADNFGGPPSQENVVAQLSEVNLGKMKQVENLVRDYKAEGKTVDYEVKTNYSGSKSGRPTSFEPKITVDGAEIELPPELKKIYNEAESDLSMIKRAKITAGEKFGIANEVGTKSALVAGGLTMAVSSVENISAYVDGEISAEDMVLDIVQDTATAGALGYGTAFISTSVSQSMSKSSSALISKVGGSCLPATAIAFGVESYEDISNFAQGKIDGVELAYNLGENAAGVAGGFAAGAAMGSVAGPVGTVVGGVVGCVIATEAYETAVELGVEGAEYLADKADELANDVVDYVTENVPEAVEDVKEAFTDFVSDVKHFKFSF